MEQDTKTIDEGLYSRQLYVLDHDTMKRVMGSNVLVIGLNGLGVEIAKNVILTGVKSVTLYDPTAAVVQDLGSNFYLNKDSLGTPRDKACLTHLTELNQYVDVRVYEGPEPWSSAEIISKFKVVVAIDLQQEKLLQLSKACRSSSTALVIGDANGLVGRIFVDCGTNFEIVDTTGEPLANNMLAAITPKEENELLVSVLDESRVEFQTGDSVTFSEVKGIEGLNNTAPRPVKVLSPYTFTISAEGTSGSYISGGYVHQARVSKFENYLPFEEAVRKPEYIITDFGKFDRPALWHLAYLSVGEFTTKNNGESPRLLHEADAQAVVDSAKSLNQEHKFVEELSESNINLVKQFAKTFRAILNPMAAFFGGVIAQEVIKGCTGKFTPIKQFLYFDALEVLPENIPEIDFQLENSRYDYLTAVVGKSLKNQVLNLRIFLVGSGAIGCELLKNFAMLGVGCGDHGKVDVTDMDTIEKSNLNRQFLFRSEHVEKLKSEVAATVAKKMNPNLNIQAHSLRVGAETENFFNSSFYDSLNGVCNALDNVDARMYMDTQCITYNKWLLESGTLGTKGNTQVIVPKLTESYASSRDPPERTIPVCTLHHFPNKIEHTIQWARDLFEGIFRNSAENVNQYLKNPGFVDSLNKQNASVQLDTLRTVLASLKTDRPTTFDDCIVWARLRFEEYFTNNIKQLLHNFPADMITSSGAPFWSGPKRAPSPVIFDASNNDHLDFIIAAANLRAVNYKLPGSRDKEYIKGTVKDVKVPEFKPKSGVKIPSSEEEAKNNANSNGAGNSEEDHDAKECQSIVGALPKPSEVGDFRMVEIEFEKDNDANFHIDFVTATSNLRATNYSIKTADRHQTKGIAGKIMPALVTTTAVVSGLVCLELLKVIQSPTRKLESFKNGFVNLALPLFAFSEPISPPSAKIREGWTWNLWDRFELQGPLTLRQLLEHFREKYKLDISMVSCNMSLLYAFFSRAKHEERMDQELAALYKTVSNKSLPANKSFLTLDVVCEDLETGEDVDVPWLKYNFA